MNKKKIQIKDNINPLLIMLYTPEDWMIKGLQIFDTEDKYILYNKTLDKSIELDKDKFIAQLNGDIFQRAKETNHGGLILSIATEIGVAPYIYTLRKNGRYIAEAINLYTFKNNKARVRELNEKLYLVRSSRGIVEDTEIFSILTSLILLSILVVAVALYFIG